MPISIGLGLDLTTCTGGGLFSVAYSRQQTDYSVFGKIGTRLYARNITNDKFAYSDDSGDTWTDASTTLTTAFGATGIAELVGHTTYMFAVLLDGRLLRANLNSFATWADKSAPVPVGTTARAGVFSSNSTGTRIYYGNYNADPGTPGAYVYRSGSSGDTWASGMSVAAARHVHAVAADPVDANTVWATVGDSAPERGLYKSTDLGVNWSKISSDTRYGIGINFAYSYAGQSDRLILEGDGSAGSANMLSFVAASSGVAHVDLILPPDASWNGSARASILTSEKNLVYASTGESGAIGPREGLWIAKGTALNQPVLLEEWASGAQPSWGRTFESGAYLFNGRHRMVRPKFVGQ